MKFFQIIFITVYEIKKIVCTFQEIQELCIFHSNFTFIKQILATVKTLFEVEINSKPK